MNGSDSVEKAVANFKAIFTGLLPQSVCLSPDGELFACIEKLVLWDEDRDVTRLKVRRASTGEEVWCGGLPDNISQPAWHRRKRRLAFLTPDGPKGAALIEWDLDANLLLRRLASERGIRGFVREGDDFLVLCGPAAPEEAPGVVEFPSEVAPAELVSTRTGAPVARLPENAASLTRSADGRCLAYVSQPTPFGEDMLRVELFLHDLPGGRRRRIGAEGRGAASCCFAPAHPGRLAFVAKRAPGCYTYRTDVFVFDTDSGEERSLSGRWGRPIDAILGWSDDGEEVIVQAGAGVRSQFVALHARTGERRVLHEGAALFGGSVRSGRVGAWIEAAPGALPEIRLEGRPPTGPRPAEACPQRIITWPDASGRVLDGLWIEPTAPAASPPYPTVLFIHGGPPSPVYDALTRTDCLQPLAAAGYGVFFPAFRGSGGYEEAFVRASIGDFAEGPLDDCLRGLNSLIDQGLADPRRLAVMGGSYGGYMTLYALTRSKRFRCGVCMCGLFDLISDVSSGSRPWYLREYLGGYPWDNFEGYWAASPMSRVADLTAPLLLLHGEDDVNTRVHHARELAYALRALGRVFRFKTYPREGHGFGRPKVRLDIITECVRWLQEHL